MAWKTKQLIKSTKPKTNSFTDVNKISKSLYGLDKNKRKKTQITALRKEMCHHNCMDIKMIIEKYLKQLYTKIFDYLGNIDQFL